MQLGEARYDQTTYMGRLSHIQELVDVKSLFLTSAEVDAAQALLSEYKRLGKLPPNTTDEQMWDAQKVVGAVVHAPTGEPMFLFGRMSAFVPMNVPIAAGLLMASTTQGVILSQWLNQSETLTLILAPYSPIAPSNSTIPTLALTSSPSPSPSNHSVQRGEQLRQPGRPHSRDGPARAGASRVAL